MEYLIKHFKQTNMMPESCQTNKYYPGFDLFDLRAALSANNKQAYLYLNPLRGYLSLLGKMNGTVNATSPWVWDTQPPYRPLTLPNLPPSISGSAARQLLAFCLHSYTPLLCLLGLFSFPRTYISHMVLWLEEHFSQFARPQMSNVFR